MEAQGVCHSEALPRSMYAEATSWPPPNSQKIYSLTFLYILFSQSNVKYCSA